MIQWLKKSTFHLIEIYDIAILTQIAELYSLSAVTKPRKLSFYLRHRFIMAAIQSDGISFGPMDNIGNVQFFEFFWILEIMDIPVEAVRRSLRFLDQGFKLISLLFKKLNDFFGGVNLYYLFDF